MTRIVRNISISMIAAALVFLGQMSWSATVTSISVGNGDGDRARTNHSFNKIINGWSVGPYEVIANSTARSWLKRLENPFFESDSEGPHTTTFTLVETLAVGGDLAWTAWHERLRTPGWQWAGGGLLAINLKKYDQNSFSEFGPRTVLTSQHTGILENGLLIDPFISENKKRMRFDFEDTLEEGTLLFIWKNLEMVGDAGADSQWIRLLEHPASVPIPGAIWLIGSGLVAMVFLRRSQRP